MAHRFNASSRWFGRLAAATALTRALPALAQDAPTAGTAGTAGTADGASEAEPAPSGPKLVIVADLADTATRNSELRAALYEVARAHGYEPAGKLDVEAVASHESLMKAGSITVDGEELRSLRTALKVAVLVRVSRDSTEGAKITARVTVVTKAGVHSRIVVTAPAAATEPLTAALDDLLPHVEPDDGGKSSLVPKRAKGATAGSLVLGDQKPETAASTREAWEKRGGLRPLYGATALITATQIRQMPFVSTGPGGRGTVPGSADATGIGGGVGVRVGMTYLPIPDPNLSTGGFVAFRFGVGLDMNVLYLHAPTHFAYSGANRTVAYEGRALWVANVPFELGFAIAAGRFSGTTSWRGALIGVAYAPALQFSMNLKDTTGEFRFNPAGAQGTVDIVKLDTSQAEGSEMQIRLTLWGLAPLDTAHPGMVSAGLGAIWY
jgi:hypothetical protein